MFGFAFCELVYIGLNIRTTRSARIDQHMRFIGIETVTNSGLEPVY